MASPPPQPSGQPPFIGAIDQGTTSSRFFIFDSTGTPVASHQVEFKQRYPHPGWHEQDPQEIVDSVTACIEAATADFEKQGHRLSDIKCIGLTNQRETTCVWDKTTGRPLHHAIVWTDTRTSSLVQELKKRPGASGLQERCGLPLSTYPSAVKLVWLLRNVAAVQDAYREGRLVFGTVDSWLLYQLNGGLGADVVVTDVTNASRTMFLNLHRLTYDDELLDFFQLDRRQMHLPRLVSSADGDAFGRVAAGPLQGIVIAASLGDQSAALVGQCAFDVGLAKNTYGTGCFLLCNVGETAVLSQHGLLATVAYDLGAGQKPVYALEGSIPAAGSAVRFLSENLAFFERAQDIDRVAASVADSGGVVFVTAFSGLFAPYWMADARGTLFGLTHHTTRAHIARACLEATCFQTGAILDAMRKDSGHPVRELMVDGGMSGSDLCMQIQADIVGIPVARPAMRETTALGAAIAAGLAVHVWADVGQVRSMVRTMNHGQAASRRVFRPRLNRARAAQMTRKWERAVRMARGWMEGDGDGEEGEEEEEEEGGAEVEAEAEAEAGEGREEGGS
ncbi:MAG: Glycerol kinase [Phylliscum demangeonii]|nr:MAG: Glycerol kinase [Phylliscum demangeonii]